MSPAFQVTKQSTTSRARTGLLQTNRGNIETPVFMPVGTQATVKAMRPEELKSMGAQILLGNTYHLYLRPGHQIIKKLGGLHQFMNWQGPILTDSGGFQVYSLGRDIADRQVPRDEAGSPNRETKLARITEDGVEFQSHVDGSKLFMTPELSMEIQLALGADILMAFDDCTPYPATFDEARLSLERTSKWEARCLQYFGSAPGSAQPTKSPQLFGIVQGGMHLELRQECMARLLAVGGKQTFAGYALGGLSVGEPPEKMYEMVELCAPLIPQEYPRYLMGVGLPQDIITCVDHGIDMFDCVIPTRNARNGMLFTDRGHIQVKQAQYAADHRPIAEACACYTCKNYSRAYLRHLHMSKEILSSILGTIHNCHYYLDLLRRVRLAITEDRFAEFKRDFFSAREL